MYIVASGLALGVGTWSCSVQHASIRAGIMIYFGNVGVVPVHLRILTSSTFISELLELVLITLIDNLLINTLPEFCSRPFSPLQ